MSKYIQIIGILRTVSTMASGSLTFEVVYGLSYVSPALRLLFTLMKLPRIFKKQPRPVGRGQASEVPAAGMPAASSTPFHPIGAEILVHGVDPITAE